MMQEFGITIGTSKQIKCIVKEVNSADPNVRSAAVGAVTEVYKQNPDNIWEIVGQVDAKVRGLLE